LRHELALLHGYNNYAEYATSQRMASTPQAVADLLAKVWEPAKLQAERETTMIRRQIVDFGDQIDLEPWDWRYYAEKVRVDHFSLSEDEFKPYLSLDNMMQAMFYSANKLYDLEFVEQKDILLHHPDAQIWEVRHKASGFLAGVFIADNYARENKQGGAWMNELRSQTRNIEQGEVYPIICNNNNFAKPIHGEPCLLSIDELRTLFHEFGHALHGLLSNVHYQRLAGTNVLMDFVELPSQIMEQWSQSPELLLLFAKHYATGATISQTTLDKLYKAREFNQGFLTVQYTAAALFDLHIHSLTDYSNFEVRHFEQAMIKALGVPEIIGLRHRLAHFRHLFSGESYAAGYYVYLWAEVLAMDAFEAFKETGNIFDHQTAKRFKEKILSIGHSKEPAEAFRSFRGRDPEVEAMLSARGLK
jgi:peptidyl-dipeptidase Dcp